MATPEELKKFFMNEVFDAHFIESVKKGVDAAHYPGKFNDIPSEALEIVFDEFLMFMANFFSGMTMNGQATVLYNLDGIETLEVTLPKKTE